MNADSTEYFRVVAPEWDRMQQSFFSEHVRETACGVAGVKPGQIAADIGAGTGFVTEALLQKGLRVFAVDRSASMMDEMRQKFTDDAPVEYRLAAADRHIPLPDLAVDYAFANMYLHHVETPAEAIREMARIVKPGGKVVITDLDAHEFEFLRQEHNDRWMGFRREEVQAWFTAVGLKNVRVDGVGESCCGTSCAGTETAQIGIFIASGEK
ncbi:MAG: class I SAM-dependent methyltransferase [candidate division Zixibacteria bacterium]|nr:class I SAM-dependent methyltransferase [candidate division Zixibacteria bacterium]